MNGLTIPTLQAQERAQARQIALERAERIATTAAEELIMTEGERLAEDDTYSFAACQIDDHTRECIEHLRFHGRAAAHETSDGYMLVQLLDEDAGVPS